MQLTLAQQDSVLYYRIISVLVRLGLEIELTEDIESMFLSAIKWNLALD